MEEGIASKRDVTVRLSPTFSVLSSPDWFIYFLSWVFTTRLAFKVLMIASIALVLDLKLTND